MYLRRYIRVKNGEEYNPTGYMLKTGRIKRRKEKNTWKLKQMYYDRVIIFPYLNYSAR